ncbi:uncharacterized protein NPIL_464161 [Nephila pilipes]|uniref:Uncharacterized protein n=1 Tax=Nephila pilipes TaxID=299642 RepID=A0A8X6N017_NEPPI|nr:uncharacterized protein NPIL_464161 [Nephila pilipes]
MGDADSESIVQVPAQEIEAWMDEAEEVVDEGLENLFVFVTNLNECMKNITSELKSLQKFQNIINALNFFIAPVAVAVLVCYGTRESFEISSLGIEASFQVIVMLLMFLSTSVGLPYYVFSIWECYKIAKNLNEIQRNFGNGLGDEESEVSLLQLYDNLLLRITNDLSLDRYIEFSRMLNTRMPDIVREGIERRRETESDILQLRALALDGESSEAEMNSDREIDDNNPTDSIDEDLNHNLSQRQTEKEPPILYQIQVQVPEESPDLSVKIEPVKNEEIKGKKAE